ncbi:MAG TPA: rRNA large subunit pseudouridine synthase E [Pseudomonadales bacterium]|nr:rRNA large subunit pseudouridine synthase E [Pseudomonadales bacterium]
MSRLVLFNKPYGVLSQFTDVSGRPTLKQYFPDDHIYPAGRLDFDSEGLLLLTDDGQLQHKISDPRFKQPKTYWVQVDGEISDTAIARLQKGVTLKDGPTRPAQARRIEEPHELWPRTPPVRYRAAIPTSWLELTITEGKNRQVRRMTAAVGFPTLRLIRVRIGDWALDGMPPGQWRAVTVELTTNAQRPARPSASARPSTRRRQ